MVVANSHRFICYGMDLHPDMGIISTRLMAGQDLQILRKGEKEMKTELLLERTEVRPTVYWYAQRLEQRLRQKDSTKGYDGWHDGKLIYYLVKATDCMRAIHEIIKIGEKPEKQIPNRSIHTAIKKCIDAGNFFMMLADNLRDELTKRGI